MDSRTLILNAYSELQKVIENERGETDFDLIAFKTLEEYHEAINNWEGNSSIDFILDYVVGEGANNVSGQGMAKTTLPNFKIFIDDSITQDKLKSLLNLRKSKKMDTGLLREIDEIRLHEHLENFKFEKGKKPRLYLNRLILMTFIEMMTTIADPNVLKKKGEILGVKGVKSFARQQFQIREKVNDQLQSANIIPKTKFESATVAWHI